MRASSFRLLRAIVPQHYGISNANNWRIVEIAAPHRCLSGFVRVAFTPYPIMRPQILRATFSVSRLRDTTTLRRCSGFAGAYNPRLSGNGNLLIPAQSCKRLQDFVNYATICQTGQNLGEDFKCKSLANRDCRS
jgi:hypothetical protein